MESSPGKCLFADSNSHATTGKAESQTRDSMEAKIDLSVRRVHKHGEELVRFTRLPTSVTHKQRVRDQQEHQTTHRRIDGLSQGNIVTGMTEYDGMTECFWDSIP